MPIRVSLSPSTLNLSADGGSSDALKDYIQPTLGHALRVWWAFYWPTTLISFVLGLFLQYGVRWVYENTRVSVKLLRPVLQLGPYVLSFAVAIFIMRYILGKTFRHFRIALLPRGVDNRGQPLPLTFSRTLRVWWTYVWRTTIYSILGWVFVIYPATWFANIFRPGPVFATIFFTLLGALVGGAVALFVIYSNILDEEMSDFRVALLPRTAVAATLGAPASSPAASYQK